MLAEAIFARLAADAGVTALVSDRIFGGLASDNGTDYPCADYSFIGGAVETTLDNLDVFEQRVELNGLSFGGYDEASKIRAAITAALNHWTEDLADGTRILDVTIVNPGTDFVSEQRCFRCLVEFLILYAPV